jgi:hypothetical protein
VKVEDAIISIVPNKAPGPDGVPNKALRASATLIKEHLTKIFNASLDLSYCPKHFRTSTTVVLRKPGKSNYTIPKAYKPIGQLPYLTQ